MTRDFVQVDHSGFASRGWKSKSMYVSMTVSMSVSMSMACRCHVVLVIAVHVGESG